MLLACTSVCLKCHVGLHHVDSPGTVEDDSSHLACCSNRTDGEFALTETMSTLRSSPLGTEDADTLAPSSPEIHDTPGCKLDKLTEKSDTEVSGVCDVSPSNSELGDSVSASERTIHDLSG